MSLDKSFFFPGSLTSKVRTSVGKSERWYFLFSSLILASLTKQTVISPDFFDFLLDKTLRAVFFILVGWTGIFFWKFLMVIFTSGLFWIAFAGVVYPAQYTDEFL